MSRTVRIYQEEGKVGMFATSNPYRNVVAGLLQHRVGSEGTTIGGFAEVDVDTGLTVSPLTGKNPIGFVGLASNFGFNGTLTLASGQGITLYEGGDFFVEIDGVKAGDDVTCDETGKIVTGGAIATPFVYATPTNTASGLAIITAKNRG